MNACGMFARSTLARREFAPRLELLRLRGMKAAEVTVPKPRDQRVWMSSETERCWRERERR